jgi:type VI secretion system protein ImpF
MPSLLLRLSDNDPHNTEDNHSLAETSPWLLNELKMLFSSRSRFTHIEAISLVNASILNYGINESLTQINELDKRQQEMQTRIKNTLQRFEPRLSGVNVMAKTDPSSSNVTFTINARHQGIALNIELVWDDYTGKLYFNE